MEQIGTALRGIYRDILKGPDQRVIQDRGWVSNTIVDRCHILLAGFVKNETDAQGLRYLAVGQGDPAWDNAPGPEPPPANSDNLVNRYEPPIPLEALKLVYLNEDNQEVTTPTRRLQITATLGENYPEPLAPFNSYPLREFGLFARLGDIDYMLNSIRHPVIHKDAATTLVRVIRLYF